MDQADNNPDKIRLRNRIKAFIVCLFLSILFWLMIGLSKDYELSLTFPVELISVPEHLIIEGNKTQEISVYIKAKGFLLASKIYLEKPKMIHIDISKFNLLRIGNTWTAAIPSRNLIHPVKTQLNPALEIKSILPDTIVISFIKAIQKSVPVKPRLSLQFEEPYRLYGEYLVLPNKVTITGNEKSIESCNEVNTIPKSIDKINTNKSIYLKIDKSKEIFSVLPESVLVTIPVEKFTESEISVPVEIRDAEDKNIKIYPENITISFMIALKDFDLLKPSSFKAFVRQTPGKKKLKVEIAKTPAFISVVKIYPEEVEYIILKK